MSTVPITTPPPPHKANKLRRWLSTSTGKGVIAFVGAGVGAVASPQVGQAVTDAADSLSKGDTVGLTAILVAGVLGVLRARSA